MAMKNNETGDGRSAVLLAAELGPPPNLKPCPFCGEPLAAKWRRVNPSARCITADCWGAKMPSVQLDIPEHVEAWNQRRSACTTASLAISHLEAVLNGARTHAQQQAADTAARDWLEAGNS